MAAAAAFLVAGAATAGGDGPVFRLACGEAEGVWLPPMPNASSQAPRVAAILGVPFSEPPVGREGRWRPPRKAACWSGRLNATQRPTQCIQWRHVSVRPLGAPQSEDCLRLNVFTPEVPAAAIATGHNDAVGSKAEGNGAGEPLPIFFWLYGGDNTMGSTEFYGPVENLVTLYGGKAVVVSVNYRVGVFGWLALKELSRVDPRGVSGNLGLLDIQIALRWVQDNAAGFGGDPKRVTVIGQSSGGTNILGLLASPASRGLFSAAISLSGSPNISMDLATAEAQNAPLVSKVGCDSAADVLACLHSRSALEIALAAPAALDFGGSAYPHPGASRASSPSRDGLTIVDGVTVPRPLLDALSGGVVDVPVIFQTMAAEDDIEPNATVARWTASDFAAFVTRRFGGWGEGVVAGINALYKGVAEQHGGAYAYYALEAQFGDGCGNAALAAAAASAPSRRNPVYLSLVTQPPSKPYPFVPTGKSAFPFHMWDYIAGFRAWISATADARFTPTAGDLALGNMLRQSWWELATAGKVTSSPWRPCAVDATVTVVVDTASPRAVVGLNNATCAALKGWGLGQRYWWVN